MKQLLIIILAICVVLFVLVPLSYIFLGRIDNPWKIGETTTYNPSYSSASTIPRSANGVSGNSNAANVAASQDLISRIFSPSYAKLGEPERKAFCANRETGLKPLTRDATLSRDGDESIISSESAHFVMSLQGPVTDWQYTNGALEDEIASFTFNNLIINALSRSSVSDCIKMAEKNFKEFHTTSSGTEYFSSPIYLNQGKPIGLQSAVLRTMGKGTIDGHLYYWYLLDEVYSGFQDRPIVTLWYSSYINGSEYWYAFRSYKSEEKDLNRKSEAVLESVDYK